MQKEWSTKENTDGSEGGEEKYIGEWTMRCRKVRSGRDDPISSVERDNWIDDDNLLTKKRQSILFSMTPEKIRIEPWKSLLRDRPQNSDFNIEVIEPAEILFLRCKTPWKHWRNLNRLSTGNKHLFQCPLFSEK